MYILSPASIPLGSTSTLPSPLDSAVNDFCKTKDSPWGWYSDCGITCPITTNDGGTKYNCYAFSEFFQYSISKLKENGAK